MSIRLTKDLRDEIVENAIRATDLPERQQQLMQAIKLRAAEIIMDAQPEGWFQLIKGHPQEWFKQCSRLYVPGDCNPMSPLTNLKSYWGIDLDDPIPVAVNEFDSTVVSASLADLYTSAQLWALQNSEARASLTAFLQSCRTVEQVQSRMPELAKHIPATSKPFPLAAPSNTLSLLSALGFDRTERAA